MNTYQLFRQDEVWRTADQMIIPLTEMSPDHRRHTLAFLRRNAHFSRRAYDWCELMRMTHMSQWIPLDIGPTDHQIECSDIEWLNNTPLVLRLAKLVEEDSHVIIDGEVVDEPTPEATHKVLARRMAAIEAVAIQRGIGSR